MSDAPYASRSGGKLEAALAAFAGDPTGWICADFGSHVGGFVDCLLRHGAARVHAVEPGRGVLDHRLRSDERVVPHEGTNALRFTSPEPCDLVTIDVGWTPQRLILPAAQRALRPDGRVITLVKPHYEAPRRLLRRGVLPGDQLQRVLDDVLDDVAGLGWSVTDRIESPIAGHGGNTEQLWLLTPSP